MDPSLLDFVPIAVASATLVAGVIVTCGGGGNSDKEKSQVTEVKGSALKDDEKPPANAVDAHDPNYQTLKICAGTGDVFGDDKKKAGGGGGGGKPKAPKDHNMAATNDPNYQTLKICQGSGEVFGEDKKGNKKKK